VKWPLVKILNLLNPKTAFKGKIEIFPALSLEVFKSSFGEEVDVRRIFVRFDGSVVRNIDGDPGTRLTDPMHLLKKLNQVPDMLKEVPAEDFVDGIVEKWEPGFRIANDVHPFSSNSVDADKARSFDTTGSQIDLYGAEAGRLRC
jgi:hypothetical protein